MIRYILVDDDPNILERVKTKIDSLPKEYELQHKKSFDSSKKAYQEINEDDFDLLIVDFEMPVYNGIELAQKIANGKKIIFLTGESNREKQVINNLDISGYLSKPFDIEEFEAIIKNKIIGKVRTVKTYSQSDLMTLNLGSKRDIRFKAEQVYYITTSININGEKPDKNYVHIYGKNDKVIFRNVRISINELNQILAHYNFKKNNQSTIINMAHVNERDNSNISLFDTKETFEITAKEKMGFVAKLRATFNI